MIFNNYGNIYQTVAEEILKRPIVLETFDPLDSLIVNKTKEDYETNSIRL